jgi:hypothetical protein
MTKTHIIFLIELLSSYLMVNNGINIIFRAIIELNEIGESNH